jgi:hypothetical protein
MTGADPAEHSVILVTLDSCRYDVAMQAHTPNLDRLSSLIRAEGPGTYTLPAHAALFNGFLPRPVSGSFSINGHRWDMIWRSGAARSAGSRVAIPFEGSTLMEHYESKGHRVIGAGGVTFFDSSDPANSLPALFPEFRYFGRPSRTPATPATRVVDRHATLTLAHTGSLANLCLEADRFFLFVNCPSTHIPYTTPWTRLNPSRCDLLERLYALHDSKETAPGAFSPDEIQTLQGMQARALEWADEQIGVLFDKLTDREPLVVVCADHGEEFGDDDRYGHGHSHPTVTTVPLWAGVLRREQA